MPIEPFRRNQSHHDVFISYAQEDKPIADAVCAKLETRCIRCWIAPRDVPPGSDFPEAIINAINGGQVVVLIFSSHANNSPHVIRELTNAVNKGRIIIPFRIEDVIPSKSMEYLISVPHWLDAVTPPLEQHIEVLVKTVECIIGTDMAPAACQDHAVTTAVSPPIQAVKEIPQPPQTAQVVPQPPIRQESQHSGLKALLPIAGILVVAVLVIGFAALTGALSLPGLNFLEKNQSGAGPSPIPSRVVDYQSSDTIVNTVTLTTAPTQTLAKDTELYVDASKDNTNAIVTIQFNGGPGMGLVRDNQVILTRSDGTVTEGKLNFNQRLSEVRLQGSRGTDRIQVKVTLYSGETKTIVDKLLLYRTYRGD
jgi:hypothetical protein